MRLYAALPSCQPPAHAVLQSSSAAVATIMYCDTNLCPISPYFTELCLSVSDKQSRQSTDSKTGPAAAATYWYSGNNNAKFVIFELSNQALSSVT